MDDLRPCKGTLELLVLTNGSQKFFTQNVRSKHFPIEVHVNELSLANILSFKDIVNLPGVTVKVVLEIEHSTNVFFDENLVKVLEYEEGIFFFDTRIAPVKVPVVADNSIVSNDKLELTFSFLQCLITSQTSQLSKLHERIVQDFYSNNYLG